jgi:hypothetical protein
MFFAARQSTLWNQPPIWKVPDFEHSPLKLGGSCSADATNFMLPALVSSVSARLRLADNVLTKPWSLITKKDSDRPT